jgi:hypothetical protein
MLDKELVDFVLEPETLLLHLLKLEIVEGFIVHLDVDDLVINAFILVTQASDSLVVILELVHQFNEFGKLVVEVMWLYVHSFSSSV